MSGLRTPHASAVEQPLVMEQAQPSVEVARHVLQCLREVRLRLHKGNPSEWQDACIAQRTGGQATWSATGEAWDCQRPPELKKRRRRRRRGTGSRHLRAHTAVPEAAGGVSPTALRAADLVAGAHQVRCRTSCRLRCCRLSVP